MDGQLLIAIQIDVDASLPENGLDLTMGTLAQQLVIHLDVPGREKELRLAQRLYALLAPGLGG